MNPVARFFAAPRRTLQVVIWLLATVVLACAAALVASDPTLDAGAPEPAPATVTIAGDGFAAGPVATSLSPKDLDELSGGSPMTLLPAFRWSGSMELPSNYGLFDTSQRVLTQFAELLFSFAGVVWGLLLMALRFALTLDLVNSFTGTLNHYFAQTWSGLSSAGIPILILAIVAGVVALRSPRGRQSGRFRGAIGAVLVLGTLQALGTAAAADIQSGPDVSASYRAAPGTPAWIAQVGNKYVSELAGQTGTLIGATNSMTDPARTGISSMGDGASGGPTCAVYVANLHGAYLAAEPDPITASTMASLSYLWQRSMYDSYTQGAYGNTVDGGRIVCHQLELLRGTPAHHQAMIAGYANPGSPYYGMGMGPFKRGDSETADRASLLAWAACTADGGAVSARPGWRDVATFRDTLGRQGDAACQDWFTSTTGGAMTAGVSNGSNLTWSSLGDLSAETIGSKGPPGVDTDVVLAEQMRTVEQTVRASYGHNPSQRMWAGASALLSAGIYAYAFGAAALGVILSQFVLMLLLMLLPWTLVLLAVPGKDGSRNATGRKLLKLTALAFGGKFIFLTVIGLTLTVVSMLFSILVDSGSATVAGAGAAGFFQEVTPGMQTFWSLVIPIVGILLVRTLTKALGLGNLMGISGATGFATAALKQSRDGRKMVDSAAKATGSSQMSAKLTKAKDGAKGFVGRRASGMVNAKAGSELLKARKRDGTSYLDEDLAHKVALGTATPMEALRQQRARHGARLLEVGGPYGPLSDELAAKVAAGKMSMREAQELEAGRRAREAGNAKAKADAASTFRGKDAGAWLTPGVASTVANPFRDPVGPASVAALRHEVARENAERALRAGPGEAGFQREWSMAAGQRFEALTAATRADGGVGTLTYLEAQMGADAFAATLPEALRGQVLAGTSGAPPMLLPPAPGVLDRDYLLANPAAMDALIASPLTLLDPAVMVRRADESADVFHARMTVLAQEQGLVSNSGAVIDTVEVLGLDRDAADYREQLADALVELNTKGAAALAQYGIGAVSAPSMAIADLISVTMVGPRDERVDVDQIVAGATATLAQKDTFDTRTQDLTRQIQDKLATLAAGVHDERTYQRTKTELTALIEREVTNTLREGTELHLETHALAAVGADDLAAWEQAQADALRARDKTLRKFVEESANLIGRAHLSAGAGSLNELQDLGAFAQKHLESVRDQVEKAHADAAVAVNRAVTAARRAAPPLPDPLPATSGWGRSTP